MHLEDEWQRCDTNKNIFDIDVLFKDEVKEIKKTFLLLREIQRMNIGK